MEHAVKKIKVALIGNPNVGKSSLFNLLTGLHQKIANFPGVTVEKKSGNATIFNSTTGIAKHLEIVDLPGTYSLYPTSPDERIPFEVLCDPNNEDYPDIVVILADGTNLKRSLFLASQVIDLKIPSILALNMMDLVQSQGIKINPAELERRIGIRVCPIIARKEVGIEELKQAIINELPVPTKDIYDTSQIKPSLLSEIRKDLNLKSNYAALQIANHINSLEHFNLTDTQLRKLKDLFIGVEYDGIKIQSYESLERYKAIQQIIDSCVKLTENTKVSLSSKLDKLLVHRVWGYVIFLCILFIIFQSIFSIAEFPMNFIDETFTGLIDVVSKILPKGVLNELIVNGVLAGIGGIVIFVPQIAMLFMFIAILEDTGYMARVSFLMDKLMRKFGLNGRSVIPLMSGVACAVPAIMSTRTISSWKERIVTILVTPLVSCSARLPVYTLLISLVIPPTYVGVFNLQGLVLMSLYLIGFLAALVASVVISGFIQSKQKSYFIMEIPVYRMPRWSNIGYSMFEKVKIFLIDAGKIIIAISIVLWFLSSRGPGDKFEKINQEISILSNDTTNAQQILNLEAQKLEYSYAGHLGHLLEPVIKPLGFDWKIGIALVTSFAAREVFVGTMTTIYSVGTNESLTVKEKMQIERNAETGTPRYTVAVGWSLMLFYAFAMQCMSTLAIVKRETGSWKWPIIQFLYLSGLAYFTSLIVYQILK
ncbi:MAG: ferrous iron transport protein B [Bacteroidota bacterium]